MSEINKNISIERNEKKNGERKKIRKEKINLNGHVYADDADIEENKPIQCECAKCRQNEKKIRERTI